MPPNHKIDLQGRANRLLERLNAEPAASGRGSENDLVFEEVRSPVTDFAKSTFESNSQPKENRVLAEKKTWQVRQAGPVSEEAHVLPLFLLNLLKAGKGLGGNSPLQSVKEAIAQVQVAFHLYPSGLLDRATLALLEQKGLLGNQRSFSWRSLPFAKTLENLSSRATNSTLFIDGRLASGQMSQTSVHGNWAYESLVKTMQRAESFNGMSQPKDRGVVGRMNPNHDFGHGVNPGASNGILQGGAFYGQGVYGEDGATWERNDPGSETDAGNTWSGDFEFEEFKRRHACIDDEIGNHAGYYGVKSLIDQLETALPNITRYDNGNKTTSFSWDLSLFRPGVYGAYQKAELILHLLVVDASAYDPVWLKAHRAIAKRIKQFEPDAPLWSIKRIIWALARER